MDTIKMKPNKQETNIQTGRWRSAEFRKKVVQKITDVVVEQGGPTSKLTPSEIMKCVERFEEKVNASAKNETEYIARTSAKVKAIYSLPKSADSKLLLPNSSGSEARKDAKKEWQEQIYQKVQKMKSKYFTALNSIYQKMSSKLHQLESSPQEPKTIDLEKFKRNKKALESIFELFGMSKSQITTDIKERVDKVEKYIPAFLKHASSYPQGSHSAGVQSKQQFVSSHSRISQTVIFRTKLSLQVLGTQKHHLTNQISQQSNMCLQEQQVAKQYSNPQEDVNQLSIIKGPGNAIQQQTHCAQQATEAFGVSINTSGISASPLIKDCNNLNEISHKPTLVSEEPSAAMQRLIKVLTSMSPEALSTSIGDIEEVIYLNDAIPVSKLVDEPPEMAQQQEQPSFILEGREMSRSINAMAFDTSRICDSTCDSFNQSEEPDLNSATSKIKRPRIVENHNLLEEIKEINKRLIDGEVVIGEKDTTESAAGGATEQSEGLVVKLLFNAVSVNQNLISHFAADEKSLIKPLRLLVPTSYPFSSPVMLDQMPLEVSGELQDLSGRAKAKLGFSLQVLDQPWSLRDIARAWERCAREAILEYAQALGGGTFSSRYGGWVMC